MEDHQAQIAQRIKSSYTEKQETKLDSLLQLHKKVKTPAEVFAYVFGTIGALVLGTGMCLAMKIIGDMMAVGVVIGLIGIALVSVTYPLYKRLLKRRKDKYAKDVLALSDEILNQ